MEDLDAPAHRFAEAGRAHRHDHEFLHVDVVVGVGAAVDDVHHRQREHRLAFSADVAIERHAAGGRRGLGGRERHREDRVRTQSRLGRASVELDHQAVECALVFGGAPDQRPAQLAVDVTDRLGDALAEVAFRVAVAQLDGFPGAGRGAGG